MIDPLSVGWKSFLPFLLRIWKFFESYCFDDVLYTGFFSSWNYLSELFSVFSLAVTTRFLSGRVRHQSSRSLRYPRLSRCCLLRSEGSRRCSLLMRKTDNNQPINFINHSSVLSYFLFISLLLKDIQELCKTCIKVVKTEAFGIPILGLERCNLEWRHIGTKEINKKYYYKIPCHFISI